MSATIALTHDQLAEIRQRALAALPLEACGLLVGRVVGELSLVDVVHPARNLCRERDRFELDPLDHIAIDRAASAAGLEILGTWHSHARGDARPSALDRAGAASGWSHMIVALDVEHADVRVWRELDGEWREHELTVTHQ